MLDEHPISRLPAVLRSAARRGLLWFCGVLALALVFVVISFLLLAAWFDISLTGALRRTALAAFGGLAVLCASAAAFQITSLLVARHIVQELALGSHLMNSLFKSALRIEGELGQQAHPSARAVHGMPLPEVRRQLGEITRSFLESGLGTSRVLRPVRTVVTWAIVRSLTRVIDRCAGSDRTTPRSVDLIVLRDRSGGLIDGWLTQALTGSRNAVSTLLGCILALLAAAGVLVLKVL